MPALAFFHIPLLEYNEIAGDGKTFGNNREGEVTSANINSGMFASFIDMKDVMGVFAGHDHDNDYLGINKGIVLGYGRVTGADAYGELTREHASSNCTKANSGLIHGSLHLRDVKRPIIILPA